jgi:hypothetical protein
VYQCRFACIKIFTQRDLQLRDKSSGQLSRKLEMLLSICALLLVVFVLYKLHVIIKVWSGQTFQASPFVRFILRPNVKISGKLFERSVFVAA